MQTTMSSNWSVEILLAFWWQVVAMGFKFGSFSSVDPEAAEVVDHIGICCQTISGCCFFSVLDPFSILKADGLGASKDGRFPFWILTTGQVCVRDSLEPLITLDPFVSLFPAPVPGSRPTRHLPAPSERYVTYKVTVDGLEKRTSGMLDKILI